MLFLRYLFATHLSSSYLYNIMQFFLLVVEKICSVYLNHCLATSFNIMLWIAMITTSQHLYSTRALERATAIVGGQLRKVTWVVDESRKEICTDIIIGIVFVSSLGKRTALHHCFMALHCQNGIAARVEFLPGTNGAQCDAECFVRAIIWAQHHFRSLCVLETVRTKGNIKLHLRGIHGNTKSTPAVDSTCYLWCQVSGDSVAAGARFYRSGDLAKQKGEHIVFSGRDLVSKARSCL